MKARKNRVSSSQVNLLNYLFFLFSLFLTDSVEVRKDTSVSTSIQQAIRDSFLLFLYLRNF